MQFRPGNVRLFVDTDKYSFGYRVADRVATCLLQRLPQQGHGAAEVLGAGSAGSHPTVGERGGAANGVGMSGAHPDRQWLLHRADAETGAVKMVEAAMMGDLLLAPERPDQVDLLAKPG